MLFSCLVDADFLDTEAALDANRAGHRGGYCAIAPLRTIYEQFMAARFSIADTPVKTLRNEIRAACLAHAGDAPGLFSLTVPTGGGKTLASLGFALRHAERHDLKRIIYVIPYTSIIEQTADVFRGVFAGIEPTPVIEHHSNLEAEHETAKSRLATENWDAPMVVTTNVQFFESLYAAKSWLFNASLRKKGMADIPETVYPSGFSEDTGEYTIWEQPSRWGLWGIRGR
jgi:CRISPR-associated endonuclease/helicase Cas3